MRDFAKVCPSFWTGDTGRRLRQLGRDAQLVALYLVTGPSATMIGLYQLALPLLCHHTGLDEEGALEALRNLSEGGFAFYDAAAEEVWVPEMAAYQVGPALAKEDNRVKGVARELLQFRKSRFFGQFLRRYGEAYHLAGRPELKPLRSPSEGPCKCLRSQEQEQEKEQENVDCSEPAAPASEPPDPVVLVFPTAGKGAKEWSLLASKLKEYEESFPGVDVLAECRKARQWCIDHPRKRKTPGGTPGFLSAWLGRAQDQGSRAAVQGQAGAKPSPAEFFGNVRET
jgi:hypothetical protein